MVRELFKLGENEDEKRGILSSHVCRVFLVRLTFTLNVMLTYNKHILYSILFKPIKKIKSAKGKLDGPGQAHHKTRLQRAFVKMVESTERNQMI